MSKITKGLGIAALALVINVGAAQAQHGWHGHGSGWGWGGFAAGAALGRVARCALLFQLPRLLL